MANVQENAHYLFNNFS